MAEKRQISDADKQKILEQHGSRCFIDGEPFSDDASVEFHHIQPFAFGGPTTLDNIAPVCKKHHRSLGTMSLQEYRDKIDLSKFFEGGEPKYLNDLIQYKTKNSDKPINHEISQSKIRLYYHDSTHDFPTYSCPTTGWKYFYGTLPVELIGNDRELQPRPLREASLWKLYRHFQLNTQISPSICRMEQPGSLLLFDGQHKAAAQIWAGRPMIECKVYINPDKRLLKETNLDAHGPYRQMSFYSHELMQKYADIFGEDWNEYMETEGEKSELGFYHFLVNAKQKTIAQARNEIALAMFKRIVDDENNGLSKFLSEKSRGRKQPLSFARLKKTFFQHMLLPPPVEDEFESESDFREDEKINLIKLMNIIAQEGLENKWNPERNDSTHKKAERIFGAGAIRAWVILLRDAINFHLRHYTDEERKRFFYRQIADGDFQYFRQFIKKIFSHKIWDDPDPSGEISARLAKDDATTAKSLFDEKELSVRWVLGA
ncbi:MAG: HNH endonuclease [Pseudomonadales bacterium]|nr:HNH endonuclease [Pseudomonadales bacterium]